MGSVFPSVLGKNKTVILLPFSPFSSPVMVKVLYSYILNKEADLVPGLNLLLERLFEMVVEVLNQVFI